MTRPALLIALAAALVAGCAPVAGAPYAFVSPSPTYGDVAASTMVYAEATRVQATAIVLAATGGAFRAIEAQRTAEAQGTQQAATQAAANLEFQKTAGAATEQASGKATGTAVEERRATQTAETVATATQAAHINATATTLAGAHATEIANAKLQQTLAQDKIWAESFEKFMSNLVVVCTAGLAVLTVVGILYLSAIAYLHAREKWIRQKRLELIPAGAGSYALLTAGQWVIEHYPAAPAVEVEAEPEPPAENAEAARLHGWRISCLRIAMFAHAYDWPFDVLGPEGISAVERPDWDRLTDFLFDCGYIVKRERSRTKWAEDKSYSVFRDETRMGFPRPFPPEAAPIVYNPRCTEAQLAQIAQKTQKRRTVVTPA